MRSGSPSQRRTHLDHCRHMIAIRWVRITQGKGSKDISYCFQGGAKLSCRISEHIRVDFNASDTEPSSQGLGCEENVLGEASLQLLLVFFREQSAILSSGSNVRWALGVDAEDGIQ